MGATFTDSFHEDLIGEIVDLGSPIHATVTAAELASLTGVSNNRARELADRGVFVRTGRNRFDARESIRAYCADLARTAKRPLGAELDREKLRVQRETADKLATANALRRGELLSAAEVEREWASILRDVRATILALPARVQQRLGHLTPHDVATLDREIRDALAEFCQPEP